MATVMSSMLSTLPPRLVCSDYGTENCYLAASQIALRSRHTDTFAGEKSYRYGKSTTNTVSCNNDYCYSESTNPCYKHC